MSVPTLAPREATIALVALAGTIALYAAARLLYARTRWTLLSPAIVTIAAVIALLRLTGVTYAEYELGGQVLNFLLGPAIVALGVPLALQLTAVRRPRSPGQRHPARPDRPGRRSPGWPPRRAAPPRRRAAAR